MEYPLAFYLTVIVTVSSVVSGEQATLRVFDVAQNTNTLNPSQGNLQSYNVTTRCGEIVTNVTSGIVYKPFEQVLENERCVWIIGVSGAVGYDINVLLLGSPTNVNGSGQGLTITGATWQSIPPHLRNFVPTSTGDFRMNNTNLVIVTFYTSTNIDKSNTGFILEYQSMFEGMDIRPISSASTHRIAEVPVIEAKYPPSGEYYTSRELAGFVFAPNNNILNGNTQHALFNIYGLDGIACWDSLNFYAFDVNVDANFGTWKDAGRICSDAGSLVFPFNDVGLLLFQSDDEDNHKGFGYSVLGC